MVKFDLRQDYYADLNLSPTAEQGAIKRSFRDLVKQVHPDRHPGCEGYYVSKFQTVQTAHEILSDAKLKATYDAERAKLKQKAAAEKPYPTIDATKPPVTGNANDSATQFNRPPVAVPHQSAASEMLWRMSKATQVPGASESISAHRLQRLPRAKEQLWAQRRCHLREAPPHDSDVHKHNIRDKKYLPTRVERVQALRAEYENGYNSLGTPEKKGRNLNTLRRWRRLSPVHVATNSRIGCEDQADLDANIGAAMTERDKSAGTTDGVCVAQFAHAETMTAPDMANTRTSGAERRSLHNALIHSTQQSTESVCDTTHITATSIEGDYMDVDEPQYAGENRSTTESATRYRKATVEEDLPSPAIRIDLLQVNAHSTEVYAGQGSACRTGCASSVPPAEEKDSLTNLLHPFEASPVRSFSSLRKCGSRETELPRRPSLPSVPEQLTQSSWRTYVNDMDAYAHKFAGFVSQMLAHFQARQEQVKYGLYPNWISAQGDGATARSFGEGLGNDGSIERAGFGAYYTWAVDDQTCIALWNRACSDHSKSISTLGEIREKVKSLARTTSHS